jgi:hypothetical protein
VCGKRANVSSQAAAAVGTRDDDHGCACRAVRPLCTGSGLEGIDCGNSVLLVGEKVPGVANPSGEGIIKTEVQFTY